MNDYEKFRQIFEEERGLRVPVEFLGSKASTSLWTTKKWVGDSYSCAEKYATLRGKTKSPVIKKLAYEREFAIFRNTVFYSRER